MGYKVCAALLFAGASLANPAPSHNRRPQCHVVYDVVHNKHCETYYDEACHEEYDVIVDTTYIEECADIVTEHCSEVSKQVHHSSAVVGHDSQVISHGIVGGYHKRSAEPSEGYGYGPQCQQHVERQCHKVPQQHERKVPRPVCHKVPRQQCHPTAHKVARKVCEVYGHGHGGHGHGHGG